MARVKCTISVFRPMATEKPHSTAWGSLRNALGSSWCIWFWISFWTSHHQKYFDDANFCVIPTFIYGSQPTPLETCVYSTSTWSWHDVLLFEACHEIAHLTFILNTWYVTFGTILLCFLSLSCCRMLKTESLYWSWDLYVSRLAGQWRLGEPSVSSPSTKLTGACLQVWLLCKSWVCQLRSHVCLARILPRSHVRSPGQV